MWLGACNSQTNMREGNTQAPKAWPGLTWQPLTCRPYLGHLNFSEVMNREAGLTQNLVYTGGIRTEGRWPRTREPGRARETLKGKDRARRC